MHFIWLCIIVKHFSKNFYHFWNAVNNWQFVDPAFWHVFAFDRLRLKRKQADTIFDWTTNRNEVDWLLIVSTVLW